MRSFFFALSLSLLVGTATAADGPPHETRAADASRVLSEIQKIPEDSIPSRMLSEAEAIAVFPDVVKAGFVVGGRRGKGLISVRGEDGTWSNPAYVTLTGGSFGFQAGVQSADVILVFRSRRGIDNIVKGKFTLGADASVAAGPVGRSAQASTDEKLKAEIYSYSRARGLFAGVALDGARMSIDHKSNQAAYGDGTTPRMIFENRAPNPPTAEVTAFRDQVEEVVDVAAKPAASN
jgi:lipid-binding SYLF domain-containing protein